MKSRIYSSGGIVLLCTLIIATFFASATTTSTPQTTTILTTVPPTTVPMTCQDTDGTDITVKGNTWGSMGGMPYNYTDSCIGTEYVKEYYCSGISASSPDMLFLACPRDYSCSNGRCVYSTPTTVPPTTYPTSIPTTTPPTTIPPTTAPTYPTTYYPTTNPPTTYQTTIPTTTSPTTYPTTYYPTTNPPTTYQTTIPTTAPPTTIPPTTTPTYPTTYYPTTTPPTTVPVTCQDSDGTDTTVKGSTSGYLGGMSYNYTDSCIGSLYVKEWYCGGMNAEFPEMIILSCPPQHICRDGRCEYSTVTTVPPSTYPTSMPTTFPVTTVPPSTNPTSIPTTTPTTTTTTTTIACSSGPGYNNCTTSDGLAGECRWGNCWALGACCYYSITGQCDYTNGHDCIMYGLGRFISGTACDHNTCSTATTTTSTVVTWPSSIATTTTTSTAPSTTFFYSSCNDPNELNVTEKGNVFGTLNDRTFNYTDTCYSANHMQEFYCGGINNTTPQMRITACADGEVCREGRCVSENSTLRECNMPGNVYPCDQMTLQKVVDSISEWISAQLNLGDVIRLILSWTDPEETIPN